MRRSVLLLLDESRGDGTKTGDVRRVGGGGGRGGIGHVPTGRHDSREISVRSRPELGSVRKNQNAPSCVGGKEEREIWDEMSRYLLGPTRRVGKMAVSDLYTAASYCSSC